MTDDKYDFIIEETTEEPEVEAEQGPIEDDKYYVDVNKLCKDIAEFVATKGFYTPTSIEEDVYLLAKLMLVGTELCEAAGAVRHHDMANFEEELADTLIRIYDIAGRMDIDLGVAIAQKMAINEGRPHLHGKKL